MISINTFNNDIINNNIKYDYEKMKLLINILMKNKEKNIINEIEKACKDDILCKCMKYSFFHSIELDDLDYCIKIHNEINVDTGHRRRFYNKILFDDISLDYFDICIRFCSENIFEWLCDNLSLSYDDYKYILVRYLDRKCNNIRIFNIIVENMLLIEDGKTYELVDLIIQNDNIFLINEIWKKCKNEILNMIEYYYINSCSCNNTKFLKWILKINSNYSLINKEILEKGLSIACEKNNIEIIMILGNEEKLNYNFLLNLSSKTNRRLINYSINKDSITNKKILDWINNLKYYIVKIYGLDRFKKITIRTTTQYSIPSKLLHFLKNYVSEKKLIATHFNHMMDKHSNSYSYDLNIGFKIITILVKENEYFSKTFL